MTEDDYKSRKLANYLKTENNDIIGAIYPIRTLHALKIGFKRLVVC